MCAQFFVKHSDVAVSLFVSYSFTSSCCTSNLTLISAAVNVTYIMTFCNSRPAQWPLNVHRRRSEEPWTAEPGRVVVSPGDGASLLLVSFTKLRISELQPNFYRLFVVAFISFKGEKKEILQFLIQFCEFYFSDLEETFVIFLLF